MVASTVFSFINLTLPLKKKTDVGPDSESEVDLGPAL